MYSNCRYEVFVWFSSPRKPRQYVVEAVQINSLKCSFLKVARWFDFANFITEKKIHNNMLCYTHKWVIHWYFKFWIFTFWNLSLKIKCRVALTKVFLIQVFLHFGQFLFYSRHVCTKRLANWTAINDTLALNGFTRNAKHGFNSWKWSHLAWNPSSSLTIYFSILLRCGLQMPLRETHWFSFRHWENDRLLLTICVFEKFYFSSGKKISLTQLTSDLGSLSLLLNRADTLVTNVPSRVRKCAKLPGHLRCEISFLRTCNIPNLMPHTYRIALSKRFIGCVSTSGVSNTNCSDGQMRTYEATGGPHYDADAIMAVPEPYKIQLLHFTSCEMYREL